MRVILVLWGFLLVSGFLGAQGDELTITLGHSSYVSSVAFSPDGKYILTGSEDKTAKLWERSSGREIRTFKGHSKAVSSVALSPDGQYILTGSWDNTAKLWERSSGREIRTFKGYSGVNSVAFSPDGQYILTGGSWDQTAKLWERSSGREIKTLKGHGENSISGGVTSVAFSPDGQYILTGSWDNTAKLWERSSGREIRTFKGHGENSISGGVTSVAFSPDGQYILTGSRDETAKLWERSSGKEIKTFKGHSGDVTSVAFSPDGQYILTGSLDNTAKLWERSSGREIRIFFGTGSDVTSVAFSPDGKYILTGNVDETAELWERSSGRNIRTFKGHSGDVTSVAFSPGGQYILTGSEDNTAKLWERSSGREIRIFFGTGSAVSSVALSPDGQYILTGSWDNTAKLWERSSGREIRTFKGHGENSISGGVTSVAFSPDGQYILTGSLDHTAKLWERSSGREVRTFEGHSNDVNTVAFSPDGQYILTGSGEILSRSRDNTAKIWERSSGREIRTLKGHRSQVNSVAFSPDGQYILTGSWDHTAKLWERSSGREIKTFKGHSYDVSSVAFSPDGQYILTGSADWTAKLWERSSGREIKTFKGHSYDVSSVAFSPDGQYILTGSEDNTVKIWSSVTLDLLCTIVSFDNEGWVVITPEGKYDGNKEGLKFLYVPNNIEDTSRKFSQVDGLLRKVTKENPAIPFALGTRAFEEEQFEEAEEEFSKTIRLQYKLQESFFLRAKTRIQLKRYREAIKDIDSLLILEPKNLEAIQLRKEAISRLENIQLVGGKPTFETLTNLPKQIDTAHIDIEIFIRSSTPLVSKYLFLNETRLREFEAIEVKEGTILKGSLKLENGKNIIYVTAANGKGESESDLFSITYRNESQQFLQRKNYALLFALEEYQHPASWKKLNNPGFDAKALKETLENRFGFEVEIVKNPEKADLKQKIREYSLKEYQKYDQLWVFFSGHGDQDPIASDQGQFIPVDARSEFDGYSHAEFVKDINAIRCPHLLFIADACFSGLLAAHNPSIKSDLVPRRGQLLYKKVDDDQFLKAELNKTTRKFLASGATVVSDGIQGQHSPFMESLLKTLNKGGGKDKILEFAELVVGVKKLKPAPVYGRFGSDELESNFLLVEKK